jgi:hypothetical protein
MAVLLHINSEFKAVSTHHSAGRMEDTAVAHLFTLGIEGPLQ